MAMSSSMMIAATRRSRYVAAMLSAAPMPRHASYTPILSASALRPLSLRSNIREIRCSIRVRYGEDAATFRHVCSVIVAATFI